VILVAVGLWAGCAPLGSSDMPPRAHRALLVPPRSGRRHAKPWKGCVRRFTARKSGSNTHRWEDFVVVVEGERNLGQKISTRSRRPPASTQWKSPGIPLAPSW
jgi:hypothetical protein